MNRSAIINGTLKKAEQEHEEEQLQREEQHERINTRVDDMINRGLIEEVRALVEAGPGLGRTASQAVGYREVQEYLGGHCDRDTMIANIKTRTRRFAKRQATWFRSLSECRQVDIAGNREPAKLAAELVASAG